MAEQFRVESMVKEDLPPLAAVYKMAFNSLDIGELWTEDAALALLSNCFERQPDLAFAAKDHGVPVGGIILGVKPWWDGNHLFDGEFFVAPRCQKSGMGCALFETALRVAIEKYTPVAFETYCLRTRHFPLQWYRHLGFREIPEYTMITGRPGELLANLVTGDGCMRAAFDLKAQSR